MNDVTIFGHAGRWFYSHRKRVLIALFVYLFVILLKNLFIVLLEHGTWFRKPLIDCAQLVEWIALTVLLVILFSGIPYLRIVLSWLGTTVILLLGVEISCLWLYEWQHRPGTQIQNTNDKEGANPEAKKGILQRLFSNSEDNPVPPEPYEPFIEHITASALGVDVLPDNFEQRKVNGAEHFRREEPVYHDWPSDGKMGYINKPNFSGQASSWSFGIPNPPAKYTTDSLGRRITGNVIDHPRKNYALFMGCSITFGVMVDDRQNLPSIFERLDTNYRSYNYGVSGYGTHHLLALFENRNLRAEIPEKDGKAFYVFFPGHISRAIGDMDSYLSWNNNSPYYFLDGDEIRRNKDFRSGRVFVSWFYEFIHKTYFGRYFDLHLPGKLRDSHYHFVAKLIEKAYTDYRTQFGNDQFYVILSPGWDSKIIPYLKELNIKYLDYSGDRLAPYWNEKYQFEGDGHPRPLMYKIVAEKLSMDLEAMDHPVRSPDSTLRK